MRYSREAAPFIQTALSIYEQELKQFQNGMAFEKRRAEGWAACAGR